MFQLLLISLVHGEPVMHQAATDPHQETLMRYLENYTSPEFQKAMLAEFRRMEREAKRRGLKHIGADALLAAWVAGNWYVVDVTLDRFGKPRT